MKKIFLIVFLSMINFCFLIKIKAQETDTFKDVRDNKIYKIIKIGEQWWFAENLNTDLNRDGNPIPEATTDALWTQFGKEKKGCWTYYEGKEENGEKNGRIYNWYAAEDYKNCLCPKGWDIAKKSDFVNLLKELGSEEDAFKQLIDGGTKQFNAILAGSRNSDCSFSNLGKHTMFWSKSSSIELETEAIALGIGIYDNKARMISVHKNNGGYLRCVKKNKINSESNKLKEEDNKNTFVDKRDNQIYTYVTIGQQVWMAENLRYNSDDGSWDCDKIKAERTLSNCGRYYNWEAAQKGCPEGWRLPTDEDVLNLIKEAGNTEQSALHSLKKGGSSGFNAVLCGDCNINTRYYSGIKTTTSFWTNTKYDKENTYSFYLKLPDEAKLYKTKNSPTDVQVVRCIKN